MMDALIERATMRSQPGHTIAEHIETAIAMASAYRCVVGFQFNGIPISVVEGSDPEKVADALDTIETAEARLRGASVTPEGIVAWGPTD